MGVALGVIGGVILIGIVVYIVLLAKEFEH
jgi:hypothetical protein